jgi:carbon storage regulator CsrA
MLILTRKRNETIHIGDTVSVTVIRVSANKVRLGISAPKEMRVMRIELEDETLEKDETPRLDAAA